MMNILTFFCAFPCWYWLIILVIVLLYIYGIQSNKVLQNLGIPGPKPTILFGNTKALSKKNIAEQLGIWREQYGNVYGFYIGTSPSIVINDLDILKEILVKDFQHFSDRQNRMVSAVIEKGVFFQRGNDWKRIRNIITPTFSSGKLKHMISSINRCGELLANNLVKKAQQGETIDVKHYFGAYTMDVIATTAFGLDIDSQTNPDEPFVQNARDLFKSIGFSTVGLLTMIFPFLEKMFKLMDISAFPRGPRNFFVKSIRELIDQRKSEVKTEKGKRSDFLQLLLDAESEEMNQETTNGVQNKSVKHLSIDEIIGQIFLFFIAGYETTSSTLNFLVYVLAHHPEIQEKIIQEIEEHIGNREPTYEDISKLTYMEQVLMETLRMYPPVSVVNRVASVDVTIKGVKIPKDMAVMIPIYTVHHNPENYPDPELFLPERFEASVKKDSNPVTFLPFGFGPRLCIGMRLALVEAKIALVYTLRKVRFVKCPQTPEQLEFKNAGILSPKAPIIVAVEEINN